jgi:chromosome segregation and condensation protein ScpB
MKLIHAKKHGSTEMLTTTNRFPEYFGIDSTKPEEIREYLARKMK